MLLTTARESEVADVAVGEVDLEEGLWRISSHRTKNKQPITLPLHPALIDDLRAVWPKHEAGGRWRLLGQIAGNGLRGYSKLKRRVDTLSGIDGWRWHDLRRTARTGLSKLGVSRDIAEACLNHISGRSGLVRVYDRHDYAEEVIAALTRWQNYVIALAAKPPSAEIVPMRRPRLA